MSKNKKKGVYDSLFTDTGLYLSGEKGENAISAQLVSNLREIGCKNADFERQYDTLRGRRKPDICFDMKQGVVIISAKLGGKKELDAIITAQEYQQSIGSTYTVAETFAVVYPSARENKYILTVLANSVHKTDSWEIHKLKDVAKTIHQYIENQPTIFTPQSSEATFIRLLRRGVEEITQFISGEMHEIFGGEEFFEEILGFKSTSKKIKSKMSLKKTCAYLLVNQLLFYFILSKENPKYSPIDLSSIKRPSELHPKYFKKVLKDDWKPVFLYDVSKNLQGKKSLDGVKKVIKSLEALTSIDIPHDVIGKVFHDLIPRDLRKIVGAYYTNVASAEILATLAIRTKNDLVLDPACGSGTLLVAAYRRKAELIKKFKESDHQRFVEKDLIGVDIMPMSAHLAVVNLALQMALSKTNYTQIAIMDSTKLSPGDTIDSARAVLISSFPSTRLEDFDSDRNKIADKSNNHIKIHFSKVDVVITNPPFTKALRIPKWYRDSLDEAYRILGYENEIRPQLHYMGYFMLLSDRFLKKGGKLAAVLPLNVLSTQAFDGIKEMWEKNYSIEHVVINIGRSAFSDSTAQREILLVASKKKPKKNHAVKLTLLEESPQDITLKQARKIGLSLLKTNLLGGEFTSRYVLQKNLFFDRRAFFREVVSYNEKTNIIYEKLTGILNTTLGDVFTKSNVDIFENHTTISNWGHYQLSIISNRARAIRKYDRKLLVKPSRSKLIVEDRYLKSRFEIPKDVTMNQLRRFAYTNTIDITNNSDMVVIKEYPEIYDFLAESELSKEKALEVKKLIKKKKWEKFAKKMSSNIGTVLI